MISRSRAALPGFVPVLLGVVLLGVLLGAALAGCSDSGAPTGERAMRTDGPDVPRGYMPTLRVRVDGVDCVFGPFMGYYLRPMDPTDLSRLEFVCFNEEQFYTRDLPANALLFTGTAVLAELPEVSGAGIPPGPARIRPLYPDQRPPAWDATRPEPADEYRHFHSLHDGSGPRLQGYWLRHVAEAAFTYDMGGRVGPDSILYHAVEPGPDRAFAPLVEFDAGPSPGRRN